MKGLILLTKYLGAKVSGSDRNESNIKDLLEKGFDVYTGSDIEKAKAADLVVYSGAVPKSDIEVKNAVRSMERGAFLGLVADNFDKTIAVAGAHGKTTVTALMTHVLKKIRYPFTAHLGGDFADGTGIYVSGKKLFLTEACEYRDSFLSLKPYLSIITNVEYDHPDYFSSFERIAESYQKFADNTQRYLILGDNSSKYVKCTDAHVRILSEGKDFLVKYSNKNKCAFVLSFKGTDHSFYVPRLLPSLSRDVAFAVVALYCLGVDPETSSEALMDYKGVKRRLEYLGKHDNADVFSDYAHHPTQIKEILEFCKQKYDYVIAVFQPHTYSRTKTFMNDFASSLALADKILLLPVFGAREKYEEAGSSSELIKRIHAKEKHLLNRFDEINAYINETPKNSVIIFLGAGDIDEYARTMALNDQ